MVIVILIIWLAANLWEMVIIVKEFPEKYDNVVLWKVKCLYLDIDDWWNEAPHRKRMGYSKNHNKKGITDGRLP